MQNPIQRSLSHYSLSHPPANFTSLCTLPTPPTLCTIECTPTSLSLFLQLQEPSTSPPLEISIKTALPPKSAFITSLQSSLLLGTRPGELLQYDPLTKSTKPVGDVYDDDSTKSGILALSASPDGGLIAVVSPFKVLLLDAGLELQAEVEHEIVAEASVSWRIDGECFVVVMRTAEGSFSGMVIERGGDMRKLKFGQVVGGRVACAWEPRPGGLIMVAVGNKALFFERNGLGCLRSDFELEGDVMQVSWSPDCKWVAVVGIWKGEWGIRVYERKNYRWFCGKSLRVSTKIACILWDEDTVGEVSVFLQNGDVLKVRLGSGVCVVGGRYAFSMNGERLSVTDFGRTVLPPPMCHKVWRFGAMVEDVCMVGLKKVGMLLENGGFEIREVGKFRDVQMGEGYGDVSPGQRWEIKRVEDACPVLGLRWPVMVGERDVLMVDHSVRWEEEREIGEAVRLFILMEGSNEALCVANYRVKGYVRAMARGFEAESVVVATGKGDVLHLVTDSDAGTVVETKKMAGVVSGEVIEISEHEVGAGRFIALTLDGCGVLKAVELETENSLIVSTDCTSYCVHRAFLSFTTTTHLLYCIYMGTAKTKSYTGNKYNIPFLIDALDGKSDSVEQGPQGRRFIEGKGATRPIDRGSHIVTAIPWDISLILQAPRGNLETIGPRPMVFEAVDEYAKSADYIQAYTLCSRQRVDMNHIVDANYPLFMQNVEKFVSSIIIPQHLSVFMTFLQGDDLKINTVCDAIVGVMKEMQESERYLSAILTGMVKRKPSDLEGALQQIQKCRKKSEGEAASALNFLFVLIKNEGMVYEHALGTYDLQLALFVARNSQMDPADYSTELKKLSMLGETMKKHTIDMRLERYSKALKHLHSCGEERYDECIALSHKHALYESALELFRDDAERKRGLLNGFGTYLVSKKQYEKAAAVFIRIGEWKKAHESYRDGGLWQLCVSALCRIEDMSWEVKREILGSVAEELENFGKLEEGAQVRLWHLGDVEGAIELLAKAGKWVSMFEYVAAYCARSVEGIVDEEMVSKKELWEQVEGFIVEGAEAVLSLIGENKEKAGQRRKRLEVVREAKREVNERLANKVGGINEDDSDAFTTTTASSMVSNLSDVTFRSRSSVTSVYSTATMQNVGPLSVGKLEKQAERRRRRESKKKVKEGHPREEEYLVGYLAKLAPNDLLKKRVGELIKALLFVGRSELAGKVVEEMTQFVEVAKLMPADVLGEEGRTGLDDRSWATAAGHVGLL